jgi:hypothetical protein
LGRAAGGGSKTLATKAFTRLFYEFALTPEATEAEDELARLMVPGIMPTRDTYPLDLGRAERLFGARRFGDARRWFDLLRPVATAEDRPLVDLRLAQCDFHLKRYPAANNALREYLDKQTTRLLEAQYYYLGTIRELGRLDEYQTRLRAFVAENPASPFAESALNDLGTYYILGDDDGKAAKCSPSSTAASRRRVRGSRGVEGRLVGPNGAVRGRFVSPVVGGGDAASGLPSVGFTGPHAHMNLAARGGATGYRQVIADYRNSYYSRQAAREIQSINPRPVQPAWPVSPARRNCGAIVAGTPPIRATHSTAAGGRCRRGDRRAETPADRQRIVTPSRRRCRPPWPARRLRPSINMCTAPIRSSWPRAGKRCRTRSGRESSRSRMEPDSECATDRGLDPFLMTALVAQSPRSGRRWSAANAMV